MKKLQEQAWLHGGIGLLAGLLIGGTFVNITARADHHTFTKRMNDHMNMSGKSHRDMPMSEMTSQLQNKSGDEFDQTFISMMIAHHQGAVEMAELARTQAKHQEVKTLADSIITAQLKEISEMYRWQKDWGYTDTQEMMHGH